MEVYAATNKKSLKTKGFHASFILRNDLFWGMDECFCRQRRRFAPTLFFFSCLDARKEAKENQGIRDASQVFVFPGIGAYGIRPIGRHPTDGECANRANYHDSLFHKWSAHRAYAIRPYMGTPKRGAFSLS